MEDRRKAVLRARAPTFEHARHDRRRIAGRDDALANKETGDTQDGKPHADVLHALALVCRWQPFDTAQ
jgi:hypothetical protein